MRVRRDSRLIIRRFPVLRPLAGGVLALLLICCIVCGIQVHRDFGRLQRTSHTSQVLLALQGRLLEAASPGDSAAAAQSPPGFLTRLQERRDITQWITEARALMAKDPAAMADLDQVGIELDRALAARHEALLLRIEGSLARDRSTDAQAAEVGALSDLSSREADTHVARGVRLLTELRRAPESSMARVMKSSRKTDLLLLCSVSLLALTAWLSWYFHREQSRYLKGARLVEEMLEAYSRRLEAMNAELEQVSLLKTQFLANTSHELLTPLNGIMGSLEILRDDTLSSPEERKEFLEQAYRSSERLLDLIHDLLDLCRLEEGNLALRSKGVDSGPLIERVIASHRAALEMQGLALLVVPPAEGWPRVQADPERLNRVLQHLLSNSLKFTEHGSIRINGRIERSGPGNLRVEVADTGIGIEPEKLPKVFELFQQGDGSNTRRFGGTGLGLTLCRHLIQGMGGRIGMESDGPGRGARAWFTVPLAQAMPRRESDESDVGLQAA
jgi:signal transduction histidine kinase